MNLFLASIWILIPAYFANMAPVFSNKLFGFKANPINEKLFGANKTYRGFISGILSAMIIIYLQSALYSFEFFNSISLLDYYNINLLLYGFFFGFGALFGDLIKSFIKRRINIKSGAPFIPFDQIDYTLGAFIILSPLYFDIFVFLIGISLSFFLNILVNYIGYKLKFRETYY